MLNNLLNQAFEESRYYRKFHHTIFVLAVTLYAGLIAIQLHKPIQIKNEFALYFFAGVILIFIPGYISYLIFTYHVKISKVNAAISIISSNLLKSVKIDDARIHPDLIDKLLDEFLFKKYGDAVASSNCLSKCAVGKGHLFFITTIWLLVMTNVVLLSINSPVAWAAFLYLREHG